MNIFLCKYRCDAAPKTTNGEAAKTTEWIPQSARSIFYHHRKARCPSAVSYSNSDSVNLLYDSVPRERKDKVACGDFLTEKSKDFASTSCHETSIDLDGDMENGVVTSDARDRRSSGMEDMWMKLDTSTPHRKIVESAWRCEHYPYKEFVSDLLKSSCNHCCNGCHHCDHRSCDCFRRHYCYQQQLSTNAKELIKERFIIIYVIEKKSDEKIRDGKDAAISL